MAENQEADGKVIAVALAASGGQVSIAQLSTVAPVGTPVYLHKQEGRMRMELEVANENALHHAENSRRLTDKNHHLRQFKRKAVFLFGQIVGEGKISDEHKEAIALLVREASQEDG